MDEELLNCKEVAKRLNVSKAHVYYLLERGDIPSLRVGRAIRVLAEDLKEYIRALKEARAREKR